MEIQIDPEGVWYHGSNLPLSELRSGSTITQWKALAEAFSHKPRSLCYDDTGHIEHDEPLVIGRDIYPHPRTTMDENAEFLTRRPIKVRLIAEL